MNSRVESLGACVQPPLPSHVASFITYTFCLLLSGWHAGSFTLRPKLSEALSGQELRKTHGDQGSTHPPPVPLPFLLKCVRGSLEASFSSSVHSRSHSSSVYTSPDWREGKLVQEAATVACLLPLLPPRQQYRSTQLNLSPTRTQLDTSVSVPCWLCLCILR